MFRVFLTLGVSGYLLYLITHYDLNFMHFEVTQRMRYMLQHGNALHGHDFLKPFDVWSFDAYSRMRFFSHLVQVLNLKFRLWLFGFIPPHPSLSLTWIFTLILSPIFMYKWIIHFLGNQRSAWMTTLLYMCSSGFLSLVLLLFHPAKPLASFSFIFCLYLGAKLWTSAKDTDLLNSQQIRQYALLLIFMFFAFMTDESFWIIWFILPVLYWEFFKKRKRTVPLVVSYFLPPLLFLAWVLWGIRPITTALGFGEHDFWFYLNAPNIISYFRIPMVFLNVYYLFSSHLVPFYHGSYSVLWPVNLTAVLAYLFWSGVFIFLSTRLESQKRHLLLRLVLATFLFVFFHTWLLLGHSVIFQSSWYYGSLFPILLAPTLVLLVYSEERLRWFKQGIFVLLLIVFSLNFYQIHKRQIVKHAVDYVNAYPKLKAHMVFEKKLTFPMVQRVWKQRDNKEAQALLEKGFPIKAYWLFIEMDFMNREEGLRTQKGDKIIDYLSREERFKT